MQVAVEPFNFLLLPLNIQYIFIAHGRSTFDRVPFDALRDLDDTRLALLCLICMLFSDVSVNQLRSTYCQS